jgi:hypothetical protein
MSWERLRPLGIVLRYALGPAARQTERALGWWPVLAWLIPVIGTGAATVLTDIPKSWMLTMTLAIMVGLMSRAAVHFYNEAHPAFPAHRLEIGSLHHLELTGTAWENVGRRALLLAITYTNRERNQRASLGFELVWEFLPFKQLGGELRSEWNFQYLNYKLFSKALQLPLAVDPQTTVDGELTFYTDPSAALELGPHGRVTIKPKYALYLQIIDHVTGARTEYALSEPYRYKDKDESLPDEADRTANRAEA